MPFPDRSRALWPLRGMPLVYAHQREHAGVFGRTLSDVTHELVG